MKKSGNRTGPRKVTERFDGKTSLRGAARNLQRKRAAPSTMSAEMLSLEENAKKFARYPGQWLLLADGKLVAHSGDYSVIANEIERKGLKDGLVYYVPKPEEAHFVFI